jgi:hypothetical protein
MVTDDFYRNQSFAGKEIRFTVAPNAFRSLAYVVAGNVCRPWFSDIPYLLTPMFWTKTPAYALQASFRGAELELFIPNADA